MHTDRRCRPTGEMHKNQTEMPGNARQRSMQTDITRLFDPSLNHHTIYTNLDNKHSLLVYTKTRLAAKQWKQNVDTDKAPDKN